MYYLPHWQFTSLPLEIIRYIMALAGPVATEKCAQARGGLPRSQL